MKLLLGAVVNSQINDACSLHIHSAHPMTCATGWVWLCFCQKTNNLLGDHHETNSSLGPHVHK